ncbi:hypothetical protein [Clostridium formicaceticum]|uniref:LITAF domain-containing protein n=1 Tax=Clostridium formicaceticum TaxID=1497 RepID=A0AAC9WGN4_9CLOT|nr:hypothetical protein [Clostridium formicaceticum]AOY76477.1 hypothetical protein BJL90_11765 [Clostridium formicaceticum]ARE86880.1 hypothetical protein CLFO_12640 [Clostridium formicaceticum]
MQMNQIPPDVLEELKKYEYSYNKNIACTNCQYTGIMGLKKKVPICKPITVWITTMIGALIIISFLPTFIGIIVCCAFGLMLGGMSSCFTKFHVICPKCNAEQVVNAK